MQRGSGCTAADRRAISISASASHCSYRFLPLDGNAPRSRAKPSNWSRRRPASCCRASSSACAWHEPPPTPRVAPPRLSPSGTANQHERLDPVPRGFRFRLRGQRGFARRLISANIVSASRDCGDTTLRPGHDLVRQPQPASDREGIGAARQADTELVGRAERLDIEFHAGVATNEVLWAKTLSSE